MNTPIKRDTPPPSYLDDPEFEGNFDICPYDADIYGKETWCNCMLEQRRACADDI